MNTTSNKDTKEKHPRVRLRLQLAIILLGAILLSYLTTFIPTPAGVAEWAEFHVPFIIETVFAVLYIGAAGLFFFALKDFNPLFQKAYRMVCAGLAILGISHLQVPIFQSLAAWGVSLTQFGIVFLTSAIGSLFILVGLLRFAKLLDLKPGFASWRTLLPLVVVCAVTVWVVPYAPEAANGVSEPVHRWRLVLMAIQAILTLSAMVIAFRVRGVIGTVYRRATTWLAMALFLQTIGAIQVVYFSLVGFESWYVNSGLLSLTFVAISILYLVAGYSFGYIGLPSRKQIISFSTKDIILYVAGLVSNTRAIDEQLDPLRVITSRTSASQELSEDDQKTLRKVYLELEDYLVNKEPVRRYTRDELRNRVNAQFDASSFWLTLSKK